MNVSSNRPILTCSDRKGATRTKAARLYQFHSAATIRRLMGLGVLPGGKQGVNHLPADTL